MATRREALYAAHVGPRGDGGLCDRTPGVPVSWLGAPGFLNSKHSRTQYVQRLISLVPRMCGSLLDRSLELPMAH